MHRHISRASESEMVDHINLNRCDNRRCNLRICNYSQNKANSSVSKNNKLGVKGVSMKKGRYRAGMKFNGVTVLDKRFKTIEEAKAAYDACARQHQGEFSRS